MTASCSQKLFSVRIKILLRDATGETVIFGKRVEDRAVYLDVREGPHTVRYAARIGDFKPLHSSAVGKALLGALGDAEGSSLLGASSWRG